MTSLARLLHVYSSSYHEWHVLLYCFGLPEVRNSEILRVVNGCTVRCMLLSSREISGAVREGQLSSVARQSFRQATV